MLEGWLHRSTALGVCAEQASFLAGTGSLWDFGRGMGEGDGASSAFVPCQTNLCRPRAQQLSLPLSSSLPAFRAELLTYDLPDAKSRLLWEHSPSGPSAFASQTWGSAWRASRPSARLPPTSPWSAHCLAALPTLFRGPLVCVWLRRLRSANPLAVFWVI